MTKKEKMIRDIGLTFDLLRQVVDNPKLLSEIPTGSYLEFVEKDFSKIESVSKRPKIKKKKYLRVRSHLELIG